MSQFAAPTWRKTTSPFGLSTNVAGMLLACCGNPRTWPWIVGLFLAFRVFDVLKPLGINKLQDLPGGVGVVADDLLAGLYASLLGQLRHLV